MSPIHPLAAAHALARWTRHDAHRFLRHDWRRYVQPGSELAKLSEQIDWPDQPRVPAGVREGGRWTSNGGSDSPDQETSDKIRVAGLVIPICIVGSKAVFGDGTWKITYICADGRELVKTGTGRIRGIIPQPRS